jgi:hypothetical protein
MEGSEHDTEGIGIEKWSEIGAGNSRLGKMANRRKENVGGKSVHRYCMPLLINGCP